MKKAYVRIRPLWQVVALLILHRYWIPNRYWISQMFGRGYWTWGKFRECGKLDYGFFDGKMFHGDHWIFPRYCVIEVGYPGGNES